MNSLVSYVVFSWLDRVLRKYKSQYAQQESIVMRRAARVRDEQLQDKNQSRPEKEN